MPAILHADLDGFFIQVEQLKKPHLQNRPVALAQHGEIIASNYAAQEAGVKKHMPPNKARAILKAVDGVVAYVHVEEGGRISYQPYREASATFFEMLNNLELASVVEKGSIDEAFILCNTGSTTHHNTTHAASTLLDPHALQVATSLAETIRQRTLDSLGMKVSVGVAHNKLLSKLASAAAKPDGVHVVGSESAVSELLSKASVSRLPGFGGKVAQALEEHNIRTAQQVSTLTLPALRTLCSTLTEQSALKLLEYSRGVDHSVPQVKLPPKSLTLQMSLTPIPTPLPPAVKGAEPVGGGGKDGMLSPLEVHGRWPTALMLKIRTNGSAGQFLSRSDRFPPWADLSSWADRSSGLAPSSSVALSRGPEGVQCAADTRDQQSVPQSRCGPTESGPDSDDNVLGAAVRTAVGLFEDMRRAHSANLPVVEVHVGASKFKTSSSSKMKSLTSLFAAGRGKGIRNPEPLVKCSSDPHSESPRCIRLGAASADDGASPRLWPTSVHAAAQRSELEQPSNGACLNPDQFRRISDVVASADDSMDAAHDQEAQQRHCGFGSPIAGLIRTDSPATTRQSPRHYETYTVDESANDDSVEKALQKSVDTCNRCIGAERDTGAGLGQESDAGPGIARYKGSSMLHVDTGTEGNRASNAELNIHENRAGFDPSALSAMPELPPPKHIEQESSCKENLKRSRSNLSMTVDFMDILWAWQRNDLNGRDVNMVADSIMKGLKHHCKRS